jgi:anaphase-promoting complex subunit 5
MHGINYMQVADQGSAITDKLLVALWHAEFQCRYGLYRSGLILLADIGLEFGLTKKSRRMVEEIMPQVNILR